LKYATSAKKKTQCRNSAHHCLTREVTMKASVLIVVIGIVLGYALFAFAQVFAFGQQQYPIMDKVASKVIAKYEQSSCEQLYAKRAEKGPPSPEEQRAIQILKSNPQMRVAFINRIAAPIANKMFDCGMIP
jgi:hypothetical protein